MAGKLSAFFGAQDMTVGNPATNLIRFSTPLLIGNLAQQLYSKRQKATFAFCRYGDHGNLCGFHLHHGRGPAHYTSNHVCTANTAGYLHHVV